MNQPEIDSTQTAAAQSEELNDTGIVERISESELDEVNGGVSPPRTTLPYVDQV